MFLRQILLSHTAEKITLIWKKKIPSRNFLKNMIGKFCTTCTVTGYLCYFLKMNYLEIKQPQNFFCVAELFRKSLDTSHSNLPF